MNFIVFEGIDGAGKTTLLRALVAYLLGRGLSVESTREPGGTPLAEQIRSLVLSRDGEAPSPRAELLLYEAARAQHVDMKIRPLLEAGTWVVCDRFTASSIAFQSSGRQIAEDYVELLNNFATAGLRPGLTVLVDIDVETAGRRQAGREQTLDRMEIEDVNFHTSVRNSFLKQSENQTDWLVLDGKGQTQTNLELIVKRLNQLGWFA